jgi:hypothetical protein
MPPTLLSCSTCKYWEKISENVHGCCGYCHRFPPPRVERPQRVPPEQCPLPTTKEYEWCGEYTKV